MDQEVILEVERLEDAEEAARRHFGRPGAPVQVEVLRQGRAGVMGLGRESWQVRCVLSSPDGSAEVRDGRIIVQAPATGGKPARVEPSGLRLRVNGQEVTGPTLVQPSDLMQVDLPRPNRDEETWEIKISPDHLQAIVTLRPQQVYYLKDAEPADVLILRTGTRTALLPPSREALERGLASAGVRFGLLPEAMARLLADPTAEPVVVAEGQPPVPAKDGRVDILVETSSEEPLTLEETDDGRVDYRATRETASIESDILIARKIPPEPGREGRGVDDAVLPVAAPQDIRLMAGSGAELAGDGLEIRSVMAGEPVVHTRGREVSVEVIPVLMHRGNVGMKSGNLQFDGGIVITGNVEDRAAVRSGLSLEIRGQVDLARLIAGADITVRGNVFGSSLTAGEGEGIPTTLWEDLAQFRPVMVVSAESHRSLPWEAIGPLATRLRERIERSVARKHNTFVDLMLLLRKWQSLAQELSSEEATRALGMVDRIQRAREKGELSPGDIRLSYALNSRIEARGNVIVSGVGLVNCEASASDLADVRGVVRGGSLFAAKGMKVREAGSPAGASTTLEVPEGASIRVEVAHPNVVLRCGRISRRIATDEYRVVFPPPPEAPLEEAKSS